MCQVSFLRLVQSRGRLFNYKAELIVSSYQVVLQELKMKMISLPTDCIKCSVRKVGERWKEMVACLNTAVEIYACCSALGGKKKMAGLVARIGRCCYPS